VGWPLDNLKALLDDRMKKSALPITLFVSLFAVGTIATLALSGALAATAAIIPIEQQRLVVEDSGTDKTLQDAGINLLELKRTLATHGAQIDAILACNNAEAHSLGMRGTPGLLVGRDVFTGIGDLAALQIAVAGARRTP
jgi:protein-disulfide isomerase